MNPIDLELPPDVVIKGCLFPTKEPAYLREDLLELDLPSGLSIDVGWYPEGDPSGAYRIVVFKDYWLNQKTEPIKTNSTDSVVLSIRELCRKYSKTQQSIREVSVSGQTTDYRSRQRSKPWKRVENFKASSLAKSSFVVGGQQRSPCSAASRSQEMQLCAGVR